MLPDNEILSSPMQYAPPCASHHALQLALKGDNTAFESSVLHSEGMVCSFALRPLKNSANIKNDVRKTFQKMRGKRGSSVIIYDIRRKAEKEFI